MPHKKRTFSKEKSVKFLLLQGNSQAVNADGKTLENVLVPVSKNYKPGTSLLMSSIAAFSSSEPDKDIEEHETIEGVFDDASTVNDSDAAEDIECLLSGVKKLQCVKISEEFDTFDDVDCEDDDGTNNSKQNDCSNDQKYSEIRKMYNEKFEEVMKGYNDDDIGSLDGNEEIGGCRYIPPESFTWDNERHKELELVLGDYDEHIKEKILNYAEDSGDEKIVEIVTEKPIEYDCESILSTYSNKYNHPTVIKEEKIKKIGTTSPTSRASESDNESQHNELLTDACNVRKKGETPEERKERQRIFKEAKKLRRELKKQNKEVFNEERKSQLLKYRQKSSLKLL